MNIGLPNIPIYDKSVTTYDGTTYFLGKAPDSGERQLGISGDTAGFTGTHNEDGWLLCPLTVDNATALRARLPWLNPVLLGQRTSFGFGDRLGVATPGHIQALRNVVKHRSIAPIFAQQSVRENSRIGRTPQQVMACAVWGVLQEGWREAWGADADHVKEIADLPPFVQAGYTFYTIDPSDHVDNEAQTDSLETLHQKIGHIPWDVLDTTYEAMVRDYCQAPFTLTGLTLTFDEETLLRALAKYGRAIVHTLTVAEALNGQMAGQAYDLEMSVDETDTPTSTHEHFFIANELLKREVPLVSLAPRFVGKFQKGVDYMGDLVEFERELRQHVAILRHFDAYKLSIHTGSDKFTIYPLIAKYADNRVHVKTAGTSYLEILRVLARQEPDFFRTLLDFSRAHFETDRKTYYLDCQLNNVPAASDLADGDLPGLLEQFDARQVLHVTFGSVLDHFSKDIQRFTGTYEAEYRAALERHFKRHLQPFS